MPLIVRVTCDVKTAWGIVGNGDPLESRIFPYLCCPSRKDAHFFLYNLKTVFTVHIVKNTEGPLADTVK